VHNRIGVAAACADEVRIILPQVSPADRTGQLAEQGRVKRNRLFRHRDSYGNWPLLDVIAGIVIRYGISSGGATLRMGGKLFFKALDGAGLGELVGNANTVKDSAVIG